MISKIGQANYGLFTLATSFITLFVMDFGLGQAVTRFLSKYKAENNTEKIRNFLGIIYKLYFSIDVIIFIIIITVFFFINVIYKNLKPDEIETFKVLYIIVGAFAVIHFPFINLDGILVSCEKFIELKSMTLINRIMTITLMVICLIKGYGVFALVTVNAVVGILVIVFKLIIINKKTDIKINFNYWDKKLLKEIFGFSVWVTVCAFAQRFIFNIMPTIIAMFSISGAVGVSIFCLASTIEGYIYTFASAINGLFMPRVAKILTKESSKKELNELLVRIGRLQFFIISYLILFWCCFGKAFITDIWHRGEFELSYIVAVLLIIPSWFQLPMEIANTVIVVENKVREQAFVFIGMAIINIVLAIPLVKHYGAIGGGISVLVAYLFRTFGIAYISNNILSLNMKSFFINIFVKFSIFLIIMLILGLLLNFINPLNNKYLKFIINILIFSLIYIYILIKFILNEYEKKLVINPLIKLFKLKIR